MNAQRPKAILFDLDDTLSDRAVAVSEFVSTLWEEQPAHLDKESFVKRCVERDSNGYGSREKFFEGLSIDLSLGKTLLREIQTRYFDAVSCRAIAAAGMESAIYQLTQLDIKIGIVTNGKSIAQRKKISSLGIDEIVGAVAISEEVGVKKPSGQIFLTACRELGTEPRECWYVGDHPLNDVWGSSKAGFSSGWVHRGRSWLDEIARCYVVAEADVGSAVDTILKLTE